MINENVFRKLQYLCIKKDGHIIIAFHCQNYMKRWSHLVSGSRPYWQLQLLHISYSHPQTTTVRTRHAAYLGLTVQTLSVLGRGSPRSERTEISVVWIEVCSRTDGADISEIFIDIWHPACYTVYLPACVSQKQRSSKEVIRLALCEPEPWLVLFTSM